MAITSKHTTAEVTALLRDGKVDVKLGKDIPRATLATKVVDIATMLKIAYALSAPPPTTGTITRTMALATHCGVPIVEAPALYVAGGDEYLHKSRTADFERYSTIMANLDHNTRCLSQALRNILADEHIMLLPDWAASNWATTPLHIIWIAIRNNLLNLTPVECDNLAQEIQEPWNHRTRTLHQHLFKFQNGVTQLNENNYALPTRVCYIWLKNTLLHLQQFKNLFLIHENSNYLANPRIENTYNGLITKIMGVLAADAQFLLSMDHNYARRAEEDLEQASKASSRSPPTSLSPTPSNADLMAFMKTVLKRIDQPTAKGEKKVEFKFTCAHHGLCYHHAMGGRIHKKSRSELQHR